MTIRGSGLLYYVTQMPWYKSVDTTRSKKRYNKEVKNNMETAGRGHQEYIYKHSNVKMPTSN